MIRYHNRIVAALGAQPPASWNTPGNLFESARNEVRWTYQLILVKDFLPRISRAEVLADLHDRTPHKRANAYVLYTSDKRANLPREFVGAADRYGHSGVRTGYRLNTGLRLPIFIGTGPSEKESDDSLLSFDPLPLAHVIDDWDRFFPATPPGADIHLVKGREAPADDTPLPEVRLQFAYKLDPTIVDPLGVVPEPDAADQAAAAIGRALPNALRPSLALLNLLRGNAYGLATGQAVATALIDAGKPVTRVGVNQMVVRRETEDIPAGGNPDKAQAFKWTPIADPLRHATPLWYYVLAEAQGPLFNAIPGDGSGVFLETQLLTGPGARTQLGWVGGRIVAEVFYGLLDADPDSVFNHPAAAGFVPRLAGGDNGLLCMRNLLDFGRGA